MNSITNFRECTLTDQELLQKIDKLTDQIYDGNDDKFPKCLYRHIPARPNDDYDLLIGELLLRFKERITKEEA
jgi:hypothetical protein